MRHVILSNLPLVIVCLVVAPYSYYWTEVARRKRGHLKFKVKRFIVSYLVFLGGMFIVSRQGYSMRDAALFSFLLGGLAGFVFVRPPLRGRRIPHRVRQSVIARDLKGLPFNPAIHHLDHIVPYSKGGDHSVETCVCFRS
jgi:hypothetical protein